MTAFLGAPDATASEHTLRAERRTALEALVRRYDDRSLDYDRAIELARAYHDVTEFWNARRVLDSILERDPDDRAGNPAHNDARLLLADWNLDEARKGLDWSVEGEQAASLRLVAEGSSDAHRRARAWYLLAETEHFLRNNRSDGNWRTRTKNAMSAADMAAHIAAAGNDTTVLISARVLYALHAFELHYIGNARTLEASFESFQEAFAVMPWEEREPFFSLHRLITDPDDRAAFDSLNAADKVSAFRRHWFGDGDYGPDPLGQVIDPPLMEFWYRTALVRLYCGTEGWRQDRGRFLFTLGLPESSLLIPADVHRGAPGSPGIHVSQRPPTTRFQLPDLLPIQATHRRQNWLLADGRVVELLFVTTPDGEFSRFLDDSSYETFASLTREHGPLVQRETRKMETEFAYSIQEVGETTDGGTSQHLALALISPEKDAWWKSGAEVTIEIDGEVEGPIIRSFASPAAGTYRLSETKLMHVVAQQLTLTPGPHAGRVIFEANGRNSEHLIEFSIPRKPRGRFRVDGLEFALAHDPGSDEPQFVRTEIIDDQAPFVHIRHPSEYHYVPNAAAEFGMGDGDVIRLLMDIHHLTPSGTGHGAFTIWTYVVPETWWDVHVQPRGRRALTTREAVALIHEEWTDAGSPAGDRPESVISAWKAGIPRLLPADGDRGRVGNFRAFRDPPDPERRLQHSTASPDHTFRITPLRIGGLQPGRYAAFVTVLDENAPLAAGGRTDPAVDARPGPDRIPAGAVAYFEILPPGER